MMAPGNRELALDGLRGMAALMVATHHAALSNSWLLTGDWGDARSPVLQLFAPGGVILFFMLTGYLFWSKARAANGKMSAWKLWRGRLYRIAPLYLFSLLLVLFVAAIQTGGHWLIWENWKSLARLFALGALKWHNVGSVNLGDYNAGVVWTLWYEWAFYLALPFIAWLATGRRIFGVALFFYAAASLCLWFGLNLQPGLFFILGMVCPVLLEDEPLRSRFRRPVAAVLALGLAVSLCLLGRGYLFTKVPSVSLAGVLFPVFLVAAAGNSFFWRPDPSGDPLSGSNQFQSLSASWHHLPVRVSHVKRGRMDGFIATGLLAYPYGCGDGHHIVVCGDLSLDRVSVHFPQP